MSGCVVSPTWTAGCVAAEPSLPRGVHGLTAAARRLRGHGSLGRGGFLWEATVRGDRSREVGGAWTLWLCLRPAAQLLLAAPGSFQRNPQTTVIRKC